MLNQNTSSQPKGAISRRLFTVGAAAIMAAPSLNLRAQDAYVGGDASEEPQGFWQRPRWVWLRRAATGEQIKMVYWQDGQLIPQAYSDISWFLRDVHFEWMLASKDERIRSALNRGIITERHLSPWVLVDPVLIDILYAYCAWLNFYKINSPLLVNSGFRHTVTNELTEGAAFDSWHTKGGAADIVIPGVGTYAIASFGRWLSGGGVGLYTRKNFVHVDRGRVRTWRA